MIGMPRKIDQAPSAAGGAVAEYRPEAARMSEREVLERTRGRPATVDSLCTDLVGLGVAAGQVLLVHSSLSSLGWVCGGAVAVILALEQALGESGTLVMPTQSCNLSDPAEWQNPPVPADWVEVIRATMPAYDPDLTPVWGMGAIPETFRKQPGAMRSGHPQLSFAARGAHAKDVTAAHSLDFGFGEDSPLARVYDLDGRVLLLGVGHDRNTSLHLAEYRASYRAKKEVTTGAPVLVNGHRRWIELRNININDEDFVSIGRDFAEKTGQVRCGQVGAAQALLMPQRALVDFAVEWMNSHRGV
jgi:aminoglycoside 3-N-acetyltransferase